VFLSRSPLSARRHCVRLTCVRHAASVDPEPGSNSSKAGEAVVLAQTVTDVRLGPGANGARTMHTSVGKVLWRQKTEGMTRRSQPRLFERPLSKVCTEVRDSVIADEGKYTISIERCQIGGRPDFVSVCRPPERRALRRVPRATTRGSVPSKTSMSRSKTNEFFNPSMANRDRVPGQ
jgi:hypothetical protein